MKPSPGRYRKTLLCTPPELNSVGGKALWLASPLYHRCRCSRGPGWRCLLRCCGESPQGCWAVSAAPHSHWNGLQVALWSNHCDHRKMPGEGRKAKTLAIHQTALPVGAAQRYFWSSDSVTPILPIFWSRIFTLWVRLLPPFIPYLTSNLA